MKSGNGWPASEDQAEIKIKSYRVAGVIRPISLRVAEACGPLLLNFAKEFHKNVEPIDRGNLDDWGYNFRPVRGTTDRLSNHASGTAIDLNSTRHPLGKSGTFTPEQVGQIRELCKKYGLKWGGDFKDRKDEMHFEVNVSPEEAKKLIAKLNLKA